MNALAAVLIVTLAILAAGLGLLSVVALRRASRTADRILAEELGHRGAHETYDREIRAWRASPRDYV